MKNNSVEERIKQMIVEKINPQLKLEELNLDTPLIGRGLGLDSVSLLELVVGIEEAFRIRFDEADLNPELFANISSIAGYVHKRLSVSA